LRGKYRRRKLTGANFRGEKFFGGVNSRMGNMGGMREEMGGGGGKFRKRNNGSSLNFSHGLVAN